MEVEEGGGFVRRDGALWLGVVGHRAGIGLGGVSWRYCGYQDESGGVSVSWWVGRHES